MVLRADDALFNGDVWKPALEKFGAATQLTVSLYSVAGQLVSGPVHQTSLFDLLTAHGYGQDLFADCARQCMAHAENRPALVIAPAYGLAVVGTSLALNDHIVGAAVAGYALVDFSQRSELERLAREAGIPFTHLWEVTRLQQPVPERRLKLHGELLQVLGDTVLRETHRTMQHERLADELAAALASKDEFLAVLSHELRTPLTPILGWARMLKHGDATKTGRAAEVIERNALLQIRLVDDLLELTRVKRGKVALDLRLCDLYEAVGAAIEPFMELARQKDVALELASPGNNVTISCDVNRLQQIVRNVVSNALKFTPRNGRITVTVAADPGVGRVTVRDTGEGIAAEFLPLVFDLFQQQERGTRRRHEGLGIGLALVKQLTELHGGQVRVTSAGPDAGTEVTLLFPLSEGSADDRTAPANAHDMVRLLKGLRVLVVEDADDTREMTRLTLESLGADVVTAKDGFDALEAVNRAVPDLVLSDLRMPRMDGFELVHELRTRPGTTHPPVIAISGLTSSADHLRIRRAGFTGHVDKPFDQAHLLAAIGAAMGPHKRDVD